MVWSFKQTDLWGSVLPCRPLEEAHLHWQQCLSPLWLEDHDDADARHQAATSQPSLFVTSHGLVAPLKTSTETMHREEGKKQTCLPSDPPPLMSVERPFILRVLCQNILLGKSVSVCKFATCSHQPSIVSIKFH